MNRLIEVLAVGVTDEAGIQLSEGTVTSYLAGTTTLSTLYQDFDLTAPHTNPATLDDAGRLIAYSDYRVKLVVTDVDGVVVHTFDNVGTNDSDVTAAISGLVAGDGLLSDEDDVWSVRVDDSTIEIASDVLRVKNDGITGAKLATSCADGSTLEVASDALRIKDAGVATAKVADHAITQHKLELRHTHTDGTDPGEGGVVLSASSDNFSDSTAARVDVTNLSVTITTTGRPVFVGLVPDGTSNDGLIIISDSSGLIAMTQLFIVRGVTDIYKTQFQLRVDGNGTNAIIGYYPSSIVWTVDTNATAGTHTYKIAVDTNSTMSVYVNYSKLIAYEL